MVQVGGSSSVGNGEFGNTGTPGASSGNQQHQNASAGSGGEGSNSKEPLWPAWVYCTRYSDRPSSGKINFTFLFYSSNLTLCVLCSYVCLFFQTPKNG